MHLFQINTTECKLSVFAHDYDHAVQQFMVYWMTNNEAELPDFDVSRRNPTWPGLDGKLLAEALDHGVPGIGHLDDVRGWSILPAEACANEVAS